MTYTDQQMFDMALEGVRGQDYEQSVIINKHGERICTYRGANGLKCAVGHMIPDELYDPKMDCSAETASGISVEILVLRFPKVGDLLPNSNLLGRLQEVHDRMDRLPGKHAETFEADMAQIAKKYKLTYTPPEAA